MALGFGSVPTCRKKVVDIYHKIACKLFVDKLGSVYTKDDLEELKEHHLKLNHCIHWDSGGWPQSRSQGLGQQQQDEIGLSYRTWVYLQCGMGHVTWSQPGIHHSMCPPQTKWHPRHAVVSCPTQSFKNPSQTCKKWVSIPVQWRGIRWLQRQIWMNSGEWLMWMCWHGRM